MIHPIDKMQGTQGAPNIRMYVFLAIRFCGTGELAKVHTYVSANQVAANGRATPDPLATTRQD